MSIENEGSGEVRKILAWLRSFDVVEQRIAEGAYVRFSTSHGEDRDRAAYYEEAADAIERGDYQ